MKSMTHHGLAILALVFAVAIPGENAAAPCNDAAGVEAIAQLGATSDDTRANDAAKSKSYDKHVAEMKDAFRKAEYARALKSCKKAYAIKPSQELGAQCGVAACRAKKKRDAQRFYKKSDKRRKRMIRKFCLTSGIKLSD